MTADKCSFVFSNDSIPPDTIPQAKDRKFSVSLGHIFGAPIKGKVKCGERLSNFQPHLNFTLNITSLDATENATGPDPFLEAGVKLCQYHNRNIYPDRF